MEKKKNHAICVFCGSSFGDDPRFRDAARDVGAGIAKAGWSLVFGGGGNGLMGDVARAAAGRRRAGAGNYPRLPSGAGAARFGRGKAHRHAPHPGAQSVDAEDGGRLPGAAGRAWHFRRILRGRASRPSWACTKSPSWWSMWMAIYNTLDSMLRAIVERGFAARDDLRSLSSGRRAGGGAEDPGRARLMADETFLARSLSTIS